jgi:hypothetical protein
MYTRLEDVHRESFTIKPFACALFTTELVSIAFAIVILALNYQLISVIVLTACTGGIHILYMITVAKFNQTENNNRIITFIFILKSLHIALDICILVVLQRNMMAFYLILGKLGTDAVISVMVATLMPLVSNH